MDLKLLWANQIAEYFHQLYLLKNEANYLDILGFNRNAMMIFKKLKYVRLMLWANPISRFINKRYVGMKSMSQCNFFAWRLRI